MKNQYSIYSLFSAFFFLICSGLSSQTLNDSLVAHFPMDGSPNDIVQGLLPVEIEGSVVDTTDRFGNSNSAFWFNGSSFLSYGDVLDMDTSLFALSLWYRLDTITFQGMQHERAVTKGQTIYGEPSNAGYSIVFGKNQSDEFDIEGQMRGAAASGNSVFGTPALQNWEHVVLNRTETSLQLFLNGQLIEETSLAAGVNINTDIYFAIGALDRDPTDEVDQGFFRGAIDDVRIYKGRSLDETEIIELFQDTPLISIDSLLVNDQSPWLVVLDEGQPSDVEVQFTNTGEVSIEEIEFTWSLGMNSGTAIWTGELNILESSNFIIQDIPFQDQEIESLDSLRIVVHRINDEITEQEEYKWTFIAINPEEEHHGVRIPDSDLSRIEIEDNPLFQLSEDFTIETWFKLDSIQDQTFYQKSRCTAGDEGFHLSMIGNLIAYSWIKPGEGCDDNNRYMVPHPIEANRWYHVAIVHRSDTILAYLNGELTEGNLLEGSYGPAKTNDEPLRLGAYNDLGGNIDSPLNGELDEFRIWNTERPIESIRDWLVTSDGIESEEGLIALYRFCPADNMIVDDINGLNGAFFENASYSISSSPVLDVECAVGSTASIFGVLSTAIADDPFSSSPSTLFQLIVDPAFNKVIIGTIISSIDQNELLVDGLSYSSNLGLYGFEISGSDSRLISVDTLNAQATPVGDFLTDRLIHGAAFDQYGRLWGIDTFNDELVEIDYFDGTIIPASTQTILQGGLPFPIEFFHVDIAFDGDTCYLTSDELIYSLNIDSGTLEEVFQFTEPDLTDVFGGCSSGPNPVPSTTGIALFEGLNTTLLTLESNCEDDLYQVDPMTWIASEAIHDVIPTYNSGSGDLASSSGLVQVGLQEIFPNDQIHIHPNPTSSVLYFSAPIDDELHLFDITGRLLRVIPPLYNRNELNVSLLEPGTYMLLVNGQYEKAIRFVRK